MNWTTKDEPTPAERKIEDVLDFGPRAQVRITYSPYKIVYLGIDVGWEFDKRMDAADRDGSRAIALRALLPMAEAALVQLRRAVAKITPDCKSCGCISDNMEGDVCEDCYAEDMGKQIIAAAADYANSIKAPYPVTLCHPDGNNELRDQIKRHIELYGEAIVIVCAEGVSRIVPNESILIYKKNQTT